MEVAFLKSKSKCGKEWNISASHFDGAMLLFTKNYDVFGHNNNNTINNNVTIYESAIDEVASFS